ncbi:MULTISPECIES: RIP metalloprotease [unclassified Sphingomonas]|uniref:M50 family metallopeptidase n=1 Tax=unclassified Sphingomonas TaxID=196159 RepID=UPI00092C084C|nr:MULTISPECIES: M50 family metallopeptidase [unclassified Sphingomonas]MBN8846679.1 site-2 protease family protein [Sphingomonas sp.]OJV34015.1 MAG: RIP metalloprotease RseP [Sphingomonas sp. 67-36]
MIQSPGLLLTLLAFVLVIGPLVFVHELGHYLAARVFGVKSDIFSIGFGREVAGWTDRRGTRWKVGWLPLGGYVRFAGDMNALSQPSAEWLALPAEERQRTFQAKPVWQRAIIVAAGPVVNFLAAILILAGFALAYGDSVTPTTVGTVVPQSAAAAIGLRPGDRITALNGRSVATFDDMARYAKIRPDEAIRVDYLRDGAPHSATTRLGVRRERDRFGNEFRIGQLGIGATTPVFRQVGPIEAPLVAMRQTGQIVSMMVETVGQVVSGRRSVKELGGPLSIAKVSGEQITLGPEAFVFLIALVSINLGFINLLPIPMLDGGHLLFYAIEAVRRRPVGPEAQEWAYRGGLAAILALMLLVTFNDLGNFGLWRSLAGLIG